MPAARKLRPTTSLKTETSHAVRVLLARLVLGIFSGYRGLASDTETELEASDSKPDFLAIVPDLTSTLNVGPLYRAW